MFNDIIVKHFTEPAFAAEMDDATHSIELGNPVCGDRIKVQLRLQDERVERVRYQAWGCATSLATGDIFCSHVEGRQIDELLRIPSADVDAMLGELDPSQHHCLEMLRTLFERVQGSLGSPAR